MDKPSVRENCHGMVKRKSRLGGRKTNTAVCWLHPGIRARRGRNSGCLATTLGTLRPKWNSTITVSRPWTPRRCSSMASLYGVVQAGFSEELLFRGLIAGILPRPFSFLWANLGQSPHLPGSPLAGDPNHAEMWGILPIIFATSLLLGWVWTRSGSIIGPWLIHASANVAACLSVVIRTLP